MFSGSGLEATLEGNCMELTRRELLKGLAGAGLVTAGAPAIARKEPAKGFNLSLNSSTIRPCGLEEKIQVAAQAGYQGIELWINELDEYASGHSLEDLGKKIEDLGLRVPNIIGLWDCIPAEDEKRAEALNEVRRKIEQARKVKSEHIAFIPSPDRPDIDVVWAAERYREILLVGEELGVIPGVEFVGFFKGIRTLGQAAAIAVHSGHPKACIIADTFHLYRGGSGYEGIRLLQGKSIAVCHFNDVPTSPGQFELGDKHRVYPGDGILPLVRFVQDLKGIGFEGWLSLELFNAEYQKMPPLENAKLGLDKVKSILSQAAR